MKLVLALLAGLLVLDVVLEWWRRSDGVKRMRQRERDLVAMRRTLDRTTRNGPPRWQR